MHDPKKQLVAFLAERVCDAFGEVPPEGPEEFATVELTGESSTRFMSAPTFAVQCWAGTDERAAQLSIAARDALLDYALEPHVRRCRVAGRYALPDPETRKPRYQLVVELVVQD